MMFRFVCAVHWVLLLQLHMDQLVVHCLTPVVYQIGHWDQAGCAEIVAETSCSNCWVTNSEQLYYLLIGQMFELFGLCQEVTQTLLHSFALFPHVEDLLNQGFVQAH